MNEELDRLTKLAEELRSTLQGIHNTHALYNVLTKELDALDLQITTLKLNEKINQK